MGMTFATFILSGKTPSLMDKLKIWESAWIMLKGLDLIIFWGISSQPELNLDAIDFKILLISIGFVGFKKMHFPFLNPKDNEKDETEILALPGHEEMIKDLDVAALGFRYTSFIASRVPKNYSYFLEIFENFLKTFGKFLNFWEFSKTFGKFLNLQGFSIF